MRRLRHAGALIGGLFRYVHHIYIPWVYWSGGVFTSCDNLPDIPFNHIELFTATFLLHIQSFLMPNLLLVVYGREGVWHIQSIIAVRKIAWMWKHEQKKNINLHTLRNRTASSKCVHGNIVGVLLQTFQLRYITSNITEHAQTPK